MSIEARQAALAEFRESYTALLLKAARLNMIYEEELGAEAIGVKPKIETIIKTVAAAYSLSFSNVVGKGRIAYETECRHVAIFLCRELINTSQQVIASSFNKDHGSVIHACRRVRCQMNSSDAFRRKVVGVNNLVRAVLGMAQAA